MKAISLLSLLGFFSLPAFAEKQNVCPEFSIPHCAGAERLDVEKDEKGCNVASCVAAEANQVDDNYQSIPAASAVANIAPFSPVPEFKPQEKTEPEVKEELATAPSEGQPSLTASDPQPSSVPQEISPNVNKSESPALPVSKASSQPSAI